MRLIESDQLFNYCSVSRREGLDTTDKPWRPWYVDVVGDGRSGKGIAYRYTASGRRAAHALATRLQYLNKGRLQLDIKPLVYKGWRNKKND